MAIFGIISPGLEKSLELFGKYLPPVEFRGGAFAVAPMTGSAAAFLCAAATKSVTLAIVPGIPHADRLAADLRLIAANSPSFPLRILDFPPPLAGDKSTLALRIKAIAALKAWSINPYPLVLVAPVAALEAQLPSDGQEALTIAPGGKLNAEILSRMGYARVPQVEKEGDFAIRGGIVDVWSPGEELPVRAEFFGDDLESVRLFDPASQTSIERVASAMIFPVAGATDAEAAQGAPPCQDLPMPPERTIFAFSSEQYDLPFALEPLDIATSALPGFSELGAEKAHHPELFESAREKLQRHLEAAEKRGAHILRLDDLNGGFEIPGLVVVSKSDRVFTKPHRVAAKRGAANTGKRLDDFDELEPGEYVVHANYGVGKYLGSHFVDRDGEKVEVFTLEYADGALLHVPAAHAHLLSRYIGVKGVEAKLHRLDGNRWKHDKENAERAVRDLASQLLSVQAKREVVPGFAYETCNLDGLAAFEASFPYDETPDQADAIASVKNDMASAKPMDRLVCGDAGYGKTEVAMRAAFIAALNGKQTAVLAPTTVLAEQHFETFTSRFDGTPVRIEAISRFQGPETKKRTLDRLATGACDIIIGTHALLTERTRFRDLGLIIIDEEQRFGVKHKEFLKTLRATADVLTLSATPIPRTLYLSMTGARDLSLLRTPPRERVAVEMKFAKSSPELIVSAIRRELERGGQVFFLHNRVTTIHKAEKMLKSILPDVRIIVAHGQMEAKELARRMRRFENGEADILLSTTIIESGIDIPRANTILIDHAENFGLSELYQLRGRVGRSTKQGYAYFLLPPDGLLDSDAQERLAALKRHGGLGGGFNLALRDLELRGAGNLLGSRQSGHIATVGFSLYCQLLKRTIARMKGEKIHETVDVKLNLEFFTGASIPFEYVEDERQRLSLLKRFAEAYNAAKIKELADEMRDRFGPPPEAARRFIKLALLRAKCARRKIGNIDATSSRAVLYEAGSREISKVVQLTASSPEAKLAQISAALD
ncbi:MAG: transcription-repair coupling factor [Kiritimatiellae bacterium]|nr:transcription-repair coupling factor [Kiritimatiellia bacterium]